MKQLSFVGQGLDRPECVVATRAGALYASDRRGAVVRVRPDAPAEPLAARVPEDFLCNGFSLLPDGTFLLANLGGGGGVWRLRAGGSPEPVLTEVEGSALPPTNFVNAVGAGERQTLWISVSTRCVPRERAFRSDIADGFIVRADRRGARVVAEGLGFANENKLHPGGEWLYVNETIARRLSRFKVRADGSLGARETVYQFDSGIWPDGLEFDQAAGVWIASVVSNRLLRLDPDGRLDLIVDDSDPALVERAEARFAANEFSREDIDAGRHGRLGNLASVSFGGPELRTVYLGSLFAERLATFRSPIPGAVPQHWHY